MKKSSFTYQDPFALLAGHLKQRFSPCGRAGQASLPFVPPGPARLKAAVQGISSALRGLTFAHLTKLERETLSASLFGGGAAFVDQVVDGILGRPTLYPELAQDARRLSARQAEADLWLQLRGICGRLYALANDSYLLTQSEAIKDGQALIALAGEDPARQAGFAAARLVLARRRGRPPKTRRRKASQAAKDFAEAQVYRMLRQTLQRHHARLKR